MELVIEGIWKRFGEKIALGGYSARVPIGGPICVMGPSGSGKTTLLRILGGLEQADSGRFSPQPESASWMFQEDRLLPWATAGENAAIGGDIGGLFAELGISGEENAMPHALSGGMRRRVALARCLARDAQWYFFDEPFKGLDAGTKELAICAILRHTAGKTAFIITHDAAEAARLGGALLRLEQA